MNGSTEKGLRGIRLILPLPGRGFNAVGYGSHGCAATHDIDNCSRSQGHSALHPTVSTRTRRSSRSVLLWVPVNGSGTGCGGAGAGRGPYSAAYFLFPPLDAQRSGGGDSRPRGPRRSRDDAALNAPEPGGYEGRHWAPRTEESGSRWGEIGETANLRLATR